MQFDAKNTYWLIDDGRIWGSAHARFITSDDAELQQWQAAGNAVVELPGGVNMLLETLNIYGLPLGELALPQTLAEQLTQIDVETATAILSGFTYDINGKTLHFSYKLEDQQNFADTANAATLATMGVPGVPQTVTWNGWELTKDAEGNTIRQLVRLTLTPQEFLALYLQGALAHKERCMELGGQRKAALEAAANQGV